MSNAANGLHINKQRWKIFLALMVLIVIAVSLILANIFVSKIADRERSKATQWVESIKKKGELVQPLSNAVIQQALGGLRKKNLISGIKIRKAYTIEPSSGVFALTFKFVVNDP